MAITQADILSQPYLEMSAKLQDDIPLVQFSEVIPSQKMNLERLNMMVKKL